MLERLFYEIYDADSCQVEMVAWTQTQGNQEGFQRFEKQKQLAEIIYRSKNN